MNLIKKSWRTGIMILGIVLLAAFCIGLPEVNVDAMSKVTTTLTNDVAIRIVDKTGQTEISELDLSLLASPTGTYVSDNFNVEVSTSNATGYRLYMTSDYMNGENYTTGLVNADDNNYEIPTLDAAVSLTDFSKANSSQINHWGYSLDNTTFSPVPANTAQNRLRVTDHGVNKELTPIYVGVNVDMTKPSGMYQNELVFTAVPNSEQIDYTLSFNANGGDKMKDTLTDMTGTSVAGDYTFTLPNKIPYRIGYGFLGWSENSAAATADYQPGDEYTLVQSGSGDQEQTLYAVWGTADFYNIAAMQQMTPAVCSSVYKPSNATGSDVTLIGSLYDVTGGSTNVANLAGYQSLVPGANTANVAQRVLYDIRDSNFYVVRKLADGNCWMTENLALGSTEQTYTLTSADTNLPDGETFTLPIASAFGTNDWDGGTTTDYHPSVRINNVDNPEFGNLYSWPAAIAGQEVEVAPSAGTNYSICPKGWILPGKAPDDVGSVPTMYDIFTAYDVTIGYPATISEGQFNTLITEPVDFSLAGHINHSSSYYTTDVGVQAQFWTRRRTNVTSGTNNYTTGASRVYLIETDDDTYRASPNGVDYARNGISIRCAASGL